eukprot:12107107-Alexandrium_andersonii.AAC.1
MKQRHEPQPGRPLVYWDPWEEDAGPRSVPPWSVRAFHSGRHIRDVMTWVRAVDASALSPTEHRRVYWTEADGLAR